MTAVVGEAGGSGYELVIKPYPSLTKSIPNMEERDRDRLEKNGEIPNWVLKKQYIPVAYGDFESGTSIWEWLYMAANLCFLVSIVLSVFFFTYDIYRWFRKRN